MHGKNNCRASPPTRVLTAPSRLETSQHIPNLAATPHGYKHWSNRLPAVRPPSTAHWWLSQCGRTHPRLKCRQGDCATPSPRHNSVRTRQQSPPGAISLNGPAPRSACITSTNSQLVHALLINLRTPGRGSSSSPANALLTVNSSPSISSQEISVQTRPCRSTKTVAYNRSTTCINPTKCKPRNSLIP